MVDWFIGNWMIQHTLFNILQVQGVSTPFGSLEPEAKRYDWKNVVPCRVKDADEVLDEFNAFRVSYIAL